MPNPLFKIVENPSLLFEVCTSAKVLRDGLYETGIQK